MSIDVSTIVIEPSAEELDPARFRRRRRNISIVLGFLAPALMMVAWQVFAVRGWVDRRLFSAPTDVYHAAGDMIASGMLWDNLVPTMRRISVGYALGASAGVVVGIVLGWYGFARAAFRPMLSALYTVPKLGVLPLFLLIFGLTETAKYAVIAYGMFLLVVLPTMDAVAKVPTSYLEAARSVGTPRLRLFVEVVLPSAMPQIFTTLRLAIGLAVLSVIGIEFVAANDGIGNMIWTSWNLFLPERMFVGIITAALLGFVANQILRIVEHFAVPWQRSGSRVVI